ncbi:hypothetical protein DRJ23_00810 [Candidatus Acetothermia bacterium]|jgi:hypothetical protein|nr:MAG: hypothetical protein DRJ23_00810 [Candidatus Acetothermia bacterium]
MKKNALVFLLVVIFAWLPAAGQVSEGKATEQSSATVAAEQLRLAVYAATLALLSPTSADQRLHTQQVINILEGANGADFVPLAAEGDEQGLLDRLTVLLRRIDRLDLEPKARARARFIAKSVLLLLTFARDEALSVLETHNREEAFAGMLKVYAYLDAALGQAGSPVYLGGLTLLLRILPPGTG